MSNTFRLIASVVLTVLLSINLCGQNKKDDIISVPLKVLTFNIFHGEMHYSDKAGAKQSSLKEVASVINLLKPDMVALQEVDCRTGRSSGLDLVTELALMTDMNPLFGRAMKFDDGEYGLGILSVYSFSSSQLHNLYSPPGSEPRIALEVLIVADSGDTLRFISTHLDHINAETRNHQVRDINKLFCADNIPSIIAGDFNAVPDSKAIGLMNEYWLNSSPENEPTSPSDNPEHRIDYIFYRPKGNLELISSKVIEERLASDHNPVLSVFEIHKK